MLEFILVHIFASNVVGGPASERVQWQAPGDCPSEAEVKERFDRTLAEGGSGRDEAVSLRFVVEAVGVGFRLTARLTGDDGSSGQRVVEGASCDDLANAAVLIAAIAVDPELVPPSRYREDSVDDPDAPRVREDGELLPEPTAPRPRPSSVDVEANEPASVHSAVSEPRPQTVTRSGAEPVARRAVRGVANFDIGVGLGRLAAPIPMVLARLGAGIEVATFRALVRVSGFGPNRGSVPGFSGSGTFGAFTVGVAACGRTLGSRWVFVGCLATDAGLAFGRGRNTRTTRSARSAWWGIEGEVGVERMLGRRWALALRGDGGVMPVRPSFVVDGQGRACCVRWGAGVRAGVVARFGGAVARG